jgi:CHAD domain-containing protein
MGAGCVVLAAKFLRRQAKQLEDQLDGACRADDIEYIHRARVASRRLRAALRVFRDCFRHKQVKRWRKHIRRMTSEFGNARDMDVQIELVCRALHTADQPTYYPGVARLLVHLERQRERLQAGVVEASKRLRRSGVLEEMQATAKRLLAGLSAEELAAQKSAARGVMAKHVERRLSCLLSCEDSLLDSEAKQQHHAMRIAVKRLRYKLEIANPVYEKQLAPFIESVKRVQTFLGEVHDCDVWLAQLDIFAAAERKGILAHFGNDAPFARLEAGIEYLRQDRRMHRHAAFRQLVEYWEDLKHERHWENLLSVLETPAPLAGALPPPASAAAIDANDDMGDDATSVEPTLSAEPMLLPVIDHSPPAAPISVSLPQPPIEHGDHAPQRPNGMPRDAAHEALSR